MNNNDAPTLYSVCYSPLQVNTLQIESTGNTQRGRDRERESKILFEDIVLHLNDGF